MTGEDAVFDNPLKEIQKHMDIIQDSISAWYGRDTKQSRLNDGSDAGDKENQDVTRSQKTGFYGRSYCDTLSHVSTVMPASLQVSPRSFTGDCKCARDILLLSGSMKLLRKW
jgi:hypothetical protein